MRKAFSRLPPIAVEERPEKITVTLPVDLKTDLERFGQYFAESSGQTPTSFNAVLVGIMTAYLADHAGYRQWVKARSREVAAGTPA